MHRWPPLLVLLALAACSKGDPQGKGPARKQVQFPVEIEKVVVRDVEYTLNAVGGVEAFERVQLTARVPGAVDAVRFVEGQTVKANDPLVDIDTRRYALAVKAAKAQVDRAAAMKREAENALERRNAVQQGSPGLITPEELATFQSRAATAAADLTMAQVTLERAELDLRDAQVRSPVTGVLQTRTVATGQYVQPGTLLATVLRRDPVLLRFKVPELDARNLKPGLALTFSSAGDPQPLRAKITAVAESADEASRMVPVTAEVEPQDKARARPGAFAEVTIPIGGAASAPVIPQTAVRPSEKGFLAYVIEGNVAHERVLQLGMRTLDGRVEVKDGLKAGESLVVRGAEALREGAQVVLGKPAQVTKEPGGGAQP